MSSASISSSSSNELLILHLTDLHTREIYKDKIKTRIRALFDDLDRIGRIPDLLIFSGDLTYSGQPQEFKMCYEELLSPLASRLRLNKRNIIFVPGNHDVNRALIDRRTESQTTAILTDTDAADNYFRSLAENPDRLKYYHSFLEEYYNRPKELFSATNLAIKGLNIGIAAFNSAWRCSGDDDKNKLFLTESVVSQAALELQKSDLRIAVIHHPLDWFHPSEGAIVQSDLKRSFNLLLSGHVHEVGTLSEVTPDHNTLLFSCRALFEGKISEEGYNLYSIDFANRKVNTHYRRYFRKRDSFDKDTEHAPDGCASLTLPVHSLSTYANSILVQRITELGTDMHGRIRQQLQRFQPAEDPVFVTPKVVVLSRKNGVASQTNQRIPFTKVSHQNSIILGATESGKTVLLQALCADINGDAINNKAGRVGVYIDLCQKRNLTVHVLESHLKNEILNACANIDNREMVLLCDHIDEKNPSQFAEIAGICEKNNWTLVVAVGSDLLVDAISVSATYEQFSLYQLKSWGPSRIREFIRKLFGDGRINIDAAYSFLLGSLRDTDIPATPVTVAMYLSVFPTLGYQISSLSFLRLLEKIEDFRLETKDSDTTYSLYNKREILMKLAAACLLQESISIPRVACEEIVKQHFSHSLLSVDISKFISILDATRIVTATDTDVSFTYFAFFDYYLAKALEKRLVEISDVTRDLNTCITVGRALELYGGLVRENTCVISSILQFIGTEFSNKSNTSLSDLDAYIKAALTPVEARPAEEVAQGHLDAKIDYEDYDSDYEEARNHNIANRKALKKTNGQKGAISNLSYRVDALKTFYNLYRNLENIDGNLKVELLDRILDFHIACNFSMIDLFSNVDDSGFRTYTGYFVTLSGQMFLSANMGNQSLELAINTALQKTKNDFKRLLLINLYADLRLPNYTDKMQDFLDSTTSPAAIEIIYHRLTHMLIHHEGSKPDSGIVSVFKSAFERRQKLYGSSGDKGAFQKAYQQALIARRIIWAGSTD